MVRCALFLVLILACAPTFGQKTIIVQWIVDNINFTGNYQCFSGPCEVTGNRSKILDPSARGVMWYGANLKFLKIGPRESWPPLNPNLHWILFNEESPCSYDWMQYKFCTSLFNVYAGLDANSTWPQTAVNPKLRHMAKRQPLSVKTKNHYRKEGHAPVLFIQSNCNSASRRDEFVSQLMEHIEVDSYGKCLHNKELPPDIAASHKMQHPDFLDYISRYKFVIAMENCVATDYVTEKLFRHLEVGVVPLYRGAPNIRDWVPNASDIILIDDFPSAEALAAHVRALDADDQAYEQLLAWKRRPLAAQPIRSRAMTRYKDALTMGGVNNEGMCKLCDAVQKDPAPLDIDMEVKTKSIYPGCKPHAIRRKDLYKNTCSWLHSVSKPATDIREQDKDNEKPKVGARKSYNEL